VSRVWACAAIASSFLPKEGIAARFFFSSDISKNIAGNRISQLDPRNSGTVQINSDKFEYEVPKDVKICAYY
jgi:hypothetical protein